MIITGSSTKIMKRTCNDTSYDTIYYHASIYISSFIYVYIPKSDVYFLVIATLKMLLF